MGYPNGPLLLLNYPHEKKKKRVRWNTVIHGEKVFFFFYTKYNEWTPSVGNSSSKTAILNSVDPVVKLLTTTILGDKEKYLVLDKTYSERFTIHV